MTHVVFPSFFLSLNLLPDGHQFYIQACLSTQSPLDERSARHGMNMSATRS